VHEASTPPRRSPGPEALRELSFRANRDGLDAKLSMNGLMRPVREVAHHAIGIAGAYAADLGCWDALMRLRGLIERGNGAARQRFDERQGGMRLVLRQLADETMLSSHPAQAAA
jgi:carboxylate-amine ligase